MAFGERASQNVRCLGSGFGDEGESPTNSGLFRESAAKYSIYPPLKKLLQFITDLLPSIFMEPEVGDKVKLKCHNGAPVRGVVEDVYDNNLLVRLNESGEQIAIASDLVTNFSLAARKAWQNMPHRRVGRPKGSRHCDRVSVTLRIDRELWEKFKHDESAGLIKDRTATINAWFRAMLGRVERIQDGVDAAENH